MIVEGDAWGMSIVFVGAEKIITSQSSNLVSRNKLTKPFAARLLSM
jgi:hypothetical protein